MKLGMSGNRNGISQKAKKTLIEFLVGNEIKEVHHGDCVGSDSDFHNICEKMKIPIIIHPPTNCVMRAFCRSECVTRVEKKASYLKRNKNIVNATDTLIAFPSTKKEILRSGTWSTVRHAKKMQKHVVLIFSDGSKDIFASK